MTYFPANVKSVGGSRATAGSWPSLAYIKWNYKASYFFETGDYLTYAFSASCGGTLIDRQTILTAAHCIPTTVDFTYADTTYTLLVTTNPYYPTVASMFSVYLGVQSLTGINMYPVVKMNVANVIRV